MTQNEADLWIKTYLDVLTLNNQLTHQLAVDYANAAVDAFRDRCKKG